MTSPYTPILEHLFKAASARGLPFERSEDSLYFGDRTDLDSDVLGSLDYYITLHNGGLIVLGQEAKASVNKERVTKTFGEIDHGKGHPAVLEDLLAPSLCMENMVSVSYTNGLSNSRAIDMVIMPSGLTKSGTCGLLNNWLYQPAFELILDIAQGKQTL